MKFDTVPIPRLLDESYPEHGTSYVRSIQTFRGSNNIDTSGSAQRKVNVPITRMPNL